MIWLVSRIEHLATEVRTTIDPHKLGDLEVEHYAIPALDATGSPARQKASEIESSKQLLSGGEVLISRLNPRKARILTIPPIAGRVALASGEFVVLRPTHVESRFLEYLLRSEATRQALDSSVQSVTRSHQRIRPEHVLKLGVRVPASISAQRAIGHFLDTETARIDALIAKKLRMINLLHEHQTGTIEAAIRTMVAEDGVVALKHLVREVTVGIVVTPSRWYTDHGIPAIRGLNVVPGRIDVADLVFLTDAGHRLHQKSTLHRGDVVVVRTGQAGAAAVVPAELDGTNCIDLLLVRPGNLDSEFLSLVLNSDWTQKHIDKHSVGSIQSHFNVEALRELPVPNSSKGRQRVVADELRQRILRLSTICAKLGLQINLLRERRRTLITAAVAGVIDIPGAAV